MTNQLVVRVVGVAVSLILAGCESGSSGSANNSGGAGGNAGLGGMANASGSANSGAAANSGGAAGDVGDSDTVVLTVPELSTSYPEQAMGLTYFSWPEAWDAPVRGTESFAKPLAPKTLRLGGTYSDNNQTSPYTTDVMAEAVAYARTVGAEPIIQIPLVKTPSDTEPTAAYAADIVKDLNITRALGVKYFCIGNEPDLYPGKVKPTTYSADDYCQTFKEFTAAMKAVDPTIKVIGPELSWKYYSSNDWFTPFVEKCGSVTDIISIHRYPFGSTQTTIAADDADGANYRTLLRRLRGELDDMGFASTPFAVTEAGLCWDDDPALPHLDGSLGTLHAALWEADNYGISLEEGVFTVNYWSIREAWDLGLVDGDTPRPAYWALYLFGQHFGPERVTITHSLKGVSVYGSRDSALAQTTAIIVNHDTVLHSMILHVSGVTTSPSDVQYNVTPASITAVVIPDTGDFHVWEYGSTEMASKSAPTQIR